MKIALEKIYSTIAKLFSKRWKSRHKRLPLGSTTTSKSKKNGSDSSENYSGSYPRDVDDLFIG